MYASVWLKEMTGAWSMLFIRDHPSLQQELAALLPLCLLPSSLSWEQAVSRRVLNGRAASFRFHIALADFRLSV